MRARLEPVSHLLNRVLNIINVEIGVSSKGKDTPAKKSRPATFEQAKLFVQSFRTTTPRVIGVQLDLEQCILRFWIDGRPLPDLSTKVPQGKAWIPTVHFTAGDHEVTLNPYCSQKQSFPASLAAPTAPFQRALLAAELESLLVAYNFETKGDQKNLTRDDMLKQA